MNPAITELDPNIFQTGCNRVKIGDLTQDVIDFLNLKRKPGDIFLWKDRFKYIRKHEMDFKSRKDYENHIIKIPEIIYKPDYIGLHPNDSSIQYIKKIDLIMLVGVRIKTFGDLNFRSSYPITETTLTNYINAGTCWKWLEVVSVKLLYV